MQPQPQVSAAGNALARLVEEVLAPGLCVACGACLGWCPHLIWGDGQVAAPDPCGLESGRCHHFCPQTPEPAPDHRRRQLLAAGGRELKLPLGPVSAIWQARSRDAGIKERAQYGGVVTSLVSQALADGQVGEAVLTARDARGAPGGIRVRTPQEALEAAGSIYSGGAALAQLNQALSEPAEHALALVGLPCQSLAAAAMRAHDDYPAAGRRLALIIGLFCTWNLPLRGLRKVLAGSQVTGRVTRFDVPPPPAQVFEVVTEAGARQIPLQQVRAQTFPGCALCPDLTAELADVSVGAAEDQPGWNTLVARTPAGAQLVEKAAQAGRLEMKEMPAESLEHLRQAATNKRRQAHLRQAERG